MDISGGKRRQKTLALLGVAEAVDHPRRHGVNRNIRRRRGTAGRQLLEHDSRIQARQPGAAHILANINTGEAKPRRLAQRRLRKDFVLVPRGGMRRELVAGKIARRIAKRALVVAELEIHGKHSSSKARR